MVSALTGGFVGFIFGAPASVNADFPRVVAAGTPFIVRCASRIRRSAGRPVSDPLGAW